MNKQRPKVYEQESQTYTTVPLHEQEAKPNNVMKKDNRDDSGAPKNLDINNDDELMLWVKKQGDDYKFLGKYLIKGYTSHNDVELQVLETGETTFMRLTKFKRLLREDLQKERLNVQGKPTNFNQILAIIQKDIDMGRQFEGRTMKSIDLEYNVIIFEDGKKEDLNSFVIKFSKVRKPDYGVSDALKQSISNEQQRLQNIEDMTTAFKNALGIQPPKIQYVQPTRDSRNIGVLRTNLMNIRDPSYIWTAQELENMYRNGSITESPVQVSGELNNTFVPELLPPKFARESQGPKMMRTQGEVDKIKTY